ncbi:MAG: ATP-binding protein [Alphaproteobacteria bacterium]|nr:ATP-binding protein [Alphaproteobacteria bacterium]
MLYSRWQKENIEKALKTRRVLIISGARQCGKTTLTKQSLNEGFTYRTLDENNMFETALDDPLGFLTHSGKTLVIDEIQKAPLLIPEIKRIVDINNEKGQFILTGSADIMSLPTVNESLAGRVKNIRLRTLTEGEIQGANPSFIQRAISQNFKDQYKGCSKETILSIALRGGYPEVLSFDYEDRKDWHKDYFDVLIERDLKNIANINRSDVLKDIVKILASWSSKYMDIGGICSGCQISKPTLVSYINYIEQLYLCEKLPAWIKTDYDRVGKKDKFYMTDTGFMASILNWHYDSISLDKDKYGKLVETFVFNELSAQVDLNSDYTMYQYRDRTNREIDFIIEDESNNIIGIEVKGGSRIGKEDFKHLSWFKDNLVKGKDFVGIVLYSGENTMRFGENLYAVPTASLWQE